MYFSIQKAKLLEDKMKVCKVVNGLKKINKKCLYFYCKRKNTEIDSIKSKPTKGSIELLISNYFIVTRQVRYSL